MDTHYGTTVQPYGQGPRDVPLCRSGEAKPKLALWWWDVTCVACRENRLPTGV